MENMETTDDKFEVNIPEGRVEDDNYFCPSVFMAKRNINEIKTYEDVHFYDREEPKTVLNLASMICENNDVVGRPDQIPNYIVYYDSDDGESESLCWIKNFASSYHMDLYDSGIFGVGMSRYIPIGKICLDPSISLDDLKTAFQDIEDRANGVGLNAHRGVYYFHLEDYSYEDISKTNRVLMYIIRQVLNKNTRARAVFAAPKHVAQNLSDLVRKETGIMSILLEAKGYKLELYKQFFQRMLARGLCKEEFMGNGNRTIYQNELEELIPIKMRTPACLDAICNEFYLRNYQWSSNKKENIENIIKSVDAVEKKAIPETRYKRIGFL